MGHLKVACLKEKRDSNILRCERKKTQKIVTILKPTAINRIQVPELHLPLKLEGQHTVKFEVDTGGGDNFLGKKCLECTGETQTTGALPTLWVG